MQLWDLVPAPDLTIFSRRIPEFTQNSLNRFLPDREIIGVKSRRARHTRTNVTAKYRAYNAETPIGRRPDAVTTTEYTLPPVGQKLLITEWETLWLQFQTGGGNALQALIAQVYDDVETNVEAIRNRIELARGQVLSTGKFTLTTENGLILEADYGLQSSHKPTAATLWSSGSATPLTDEQAWVQTIRNDSGESPAATIMPLQIVNYLLRNSEYRSSYWGGAAASSPNLSRAQLNQVRADFDLPPITVYDHRLSVDGVDTRVTPANKIIMLTADAGETQFGITAESLELVGSNSVDFTAADAPGIFSAVYKNPDPVEGWTKSTAVAMPVLGNPDGLLAATVA